MNVGYYDSLSLMSDKYLFFTLHIAFAFLDTFWSAYNQEKGTIPK